MDILPIFVVCCICLSTALPIGRESKRLWIQNQSPGAFQAGPLAFGQQAGQFNLAGNSPRQMVSSISQQGAQGVNENTGSSDISVINTNTNPGIQQTVNGFGLFNPGETNSVLKAPPGTGNSQFNNNMGSLNSMVNIFGGRGLSVDGSIFSKPRQNPDGSISGAAGNGNGPPTMGPGFFQLGSGNGDGNNINDVNFMFGPPSFFMNPSSSFGQK